MAASGFQNDVSEGLAIAPRERARPAHTLPIRLSDTLRALTADGP